MPIFDLNGQWQLTYGPRGKNPPKNPAELLLAGWPTIPAIVPGNVELDLIAAGKLRELAVGNRIYDLRELESHDWWYCRRFTAPQPGLDKLVELVFDGLDCLATCWLNGQQIGSADNMLIPHRFDVTGVLLIGQENLLVVRIESAVVVGRQREVAPGEIATALGSEGLAIRKAPHMYGWDIMPRVVSAGIWRGVHMDVLEPTRLRSVYFTTLKVDPPLRTARVLAEWDIVTDRASVDGLKVRITLSHDQHHHHSFEYPVTSTHGRVARDLQDVQLWWSRGLGKANLYDLQVELIDEADRLLDSYTRQVGIRCVQLNRTATTSHESPGEFAFIVNGQRTFIRGTNWVPLDALHSRDIQHLDTALNMLADLNCNMVRCWGGNVYEDHAFFDFCDRSGIMVWQDFALACGIYPQDDAFADAITHEAETIIAKLRNHPSLVLWAGNNEGDEAYGWTGIGVDPNTDRISRQILPAAVRKMDPLRGYLPSSPYRAPEVMAHPAGIAKVQPEQHLWGPRDDFKGAYYTQSVAHFASEIGYHGCPDRASLEQFIDRDFLWPMQDNDQWLTHAVRPHREMHAYDYRIELMAKQVRLLFGTAPENLDDFILASQISQAEAVKFFIEMFRLAKWRRSGILWWNLRDGWPIISDAVVDYYNRKKLAYEYIRRVQADVCVMVAEPADGRHAIAVVNDTLVSQTGWLTVHDTDSGQELAKKSFSVEANGITTAGSLSAVTQPALWQISWQLDDTSIVGRNHYLAGRRPFDLQQYQQWMGAMNIPDEVGPARQNR